MKYYIVQMIGGRRVGTETSDIAAWASAHGVEIVRYTDDASTHRELRFQPVLASSFGPVSGGRGIVRYEDWASVPTH